MHLLADAAYLEKLGNSMNQEEIKIIVENQRSYFRSGKTLDVEMRMQHLLTLKAAIETREDRIHEALKKDLGKSAHEAYMCETGMTLAEITHMLSHGRKYAKEKTVLTPLAQFCSRSYQKPSPHGVVLIMSPWNYPFLLTMEPLVDALAAGNTVVLKPSAYSPETTKIMKEIIEDCFPAEYVTVITGGREENQHLLGEHFDYIFFTGSKAVGKEVMRKAAEHLTPVTLELGGKSPCIVTESANIKLAAKRIVFGKFLNCGQTCVAPDYIYCDRKIKNKLLAEIKKQIRKQYGKNPFSNKDYGKMINLKHFDRVYKLIDPEKVVVGGDIMPLKLQIAPTVMDGVTFDDKVMQEEIFGPVLPVLTYETLDEAIQKVNELPHPLALYVFTSEKAAAKKLTSTIGFGGGCINDTIIHLATSNMGFGGFGESGMGAYHGKAGFDTFTHYKSIVDKKTWLDLPMRYQPYKKRNDDLIHRFMH